MQQNLADMPVMAVADASQLEEAMAQAMASQTKLEVLGNGTMQGLGRPVEADAILDLKSMSGITLYEPDELVMTAHAATPLAVIMEELEKAGQVLAFDPPLRVQGGHAQGTIGGVMATNQSGSRRMVAGAARDYLLGFKAISGRGEAFQSGSRVMKNVTGYDLSKLMAGSFGTLAVMHEVTLKTMPKPETSASVLCQCKNAEAAGQLIKAVFSSPHEATMASIIPSAVAVFSSSATLKDFASKDVITVIRVEGFETSVTARSTELAALANTIEGVSSILTVSEEDSNTIHSDIREVTLLPRQNNRVIYKISCPPDAGASLLETLSKRPNSRAYADWAGGLIWVSHPEGGDAGINVIRELVAQTGGHVTLVEASPDMRRKLPVFQPQPPALMTLTKRVKASFDPQGILNPGRMYEGV